jgi:hypothetical protein
MKLLTKLEKSSLVYPVLQRMNATILTGSKNGLPTSSYLI